MALGRTCYGDSKLIAEFIANEFYKFGCIAQITTGTCPAKRQIAAKSEDIVYTVVKIILQLLTDTLTGIADASEMSYGITSLCFYSIQNGHLQTDVGTACAVSAGDIVGLHGHQLIQNATFTKKSFRSLFGLRGKQLKRECHTFFHDIGNFTHGSYSSP